MIFLSSSGDSAGSSWRSCSLCLPSKAAGSCCWNSCLHRLITELGTSNFRHTASMVVSRWKLSITAFNLNSDVYCLRLLVIGSYLLSLLTVYFIRYVTHVCPPGQFD